MSILNANTEEPGVERVASFLKIKATTIVEQMVRGWEQAFYTLWRDNSSHTPEEKIAALGADAAELFQASHDMVTFLNEQLVGKRDDLLKKVNALVKTIPPHTIHEDGTVTLDT